MTTYVFELTDFNSEVTFDFQGCLESVVVLEFAKKAHIIAVLID